MHKAKIILFNFIIIPQIILASYINTGDASAKSSSQINTDGENVVVENNEASAYSNTGGNSSPNDINTGDTSAVAEVNTNNAQVEVKLENAVATSQSKMKEKSAKPSIISYWQRFLNFIFSFFKQ